MLRGTIDALTSSGFVTGWACDSDSPLTPLTIVIADAANNELARGLAFQYRDELAKVGQGAGWYGFRARIQIGTHAKARVAINRLQRRKLQLFDQRSGTLIASRTRTPLIDDADHFITALHELAALDPTTTQSLESLRACDAHFHRFISRRGIDAFIRTAYAYVLGRAADATGLAGYSQLLRQQTCEPHELLLKLAASAEFQARGGGVAAPWSDAFPFR